MEDTKYDHLIHLRFEYFEALTGKRDILKSQESFVRVAKKLKEYQDLREAEMKLRAKLHRRLAEMATLIRKLQKNMPEVEIPDILKREEPKEYTETEEPEKKERKKETKKKKPKEKDDKDRDIESQLKDIQRKLKQLQK